MTFGRSVPLFLALACSGYAQPLLPLPGCETDPSIARALQTDLDEGKLDRMRWREREAYEESVLTRLIAEHPREPDPYRRLADLLRNSAPDKFQAYRDQRAAAARQHPEDPLALLLAGQALIGRNTPEGIRLLKQARTQAPDFAWPALTLAGIYFDGAYENDMEAKRNLAAFFKLCPASTDIYAQWWLTKDATLAKQVDVSVAADEQARLPRETDPKQLATEYSDLWSREFRLHSPAEHPQVRASIHRDLARLRRLHPKGDAAWQAFLIKGLKQSEAGDQAVAAAEDALLRGHPHSSEAYRIVRTRWDDAHKEPEDQSDAAAWDAYRKARRAAVRKWIGAYTEDTFLQRNTWFLELSEDPNAPAPELLAALDAWLRNARAYDSPDWNANNFAFASEVLLDRGLEPQRALDLAREARSATLKLRPIYADNDNLSPKQKENQAEVRLSTDQDQAALILRAALQLREPGTAHDIRTIVDAPAPESKKQLSAYWANRARLAALENHPDEALKSYQLAMETRTEPPKPYGGRLKDELADEAHLVWKKEGRQETAWVAWKNAASANTSVAGGEGRWEKPEKGLPAFELTDLSGRTWRTEQLKGKVVLINMWATWCGPCQAELPHLQKLYDKYKDRPDFQILTLNADTEPGLVAPFLKRKSYTFPVLPIEQTNIPFPDAIPMNWILDGRGVSRWTLLGYGPGSDEEFERDMMARVDAVRAP